MGTVWTERFMLRPVAHCRGGCLELGRTLAETLVRVIPVGLPQGKECGALKGWMWQLASAKSRMGGSLTAPGPDE